MCESWIIFSVLRTSSYVFLYLPFFPITFDLFLQNAVLAPYSLFSFENGVVSSQIAVKGIASLSEGCVITMPRLEKECVH